MNVTLLLLPKLQKNAVFAIPLMGFVGAVLVFFPHYQALRSDERELAQIRSTVLAKQTTLAQLKNMPLGPTVARVPATRDEPVEFLRNLNQLAARCQVRLISYTAIVTPPPTPAPPPVPGGAGGSKPPLPTGDAALPPGTTPSGLNIKAEGTYAATALFFGRLETYPRLLSVSHVTMKVNEDNYPIVATDFELTRYLGDAETAPTPAPSATPPK